MRAASAPLISVVFVTYKRVDRLKETLETFLRNTEYPNLELIVTDDGSDPEIQQEIRKLPFDVFALAAENRGLGANNNNGLRHCTGKYILMLQDDWTCLGPNDYLANAVAVMEANPQLGIINFGGAPHSPDFARRLSGSPEPCYVTPAPLDIGTHEHFLYTDNPHLKSKDSFDEIGFYKEDRDMEACERDYELRWKAQSKFSTAIFPAYHRRIFVHTGDQESFRTSMFRHRIQTPLIPLAHFLKRHCSPLYHFGKFAVRAVVGIAEKLRLVR